MSSSRQAGQSCRILDKGKQGRGRFLDCNVTGLCQILPYCRFSCTSSSLGFLERLGVTWIVLFDDPINLDLNVILLSAPSLLPCQCVGRSPSVPTRAADLRLDDVDIVAAIGDSDTAAFAAGSGGLGSYLTDYWGLSYSTGMYNFVHHPFSVATI